MINGEARPNFCADTFIVQLEGLRFKGLTDRSSATGQAGEELIYDFSLYYA